MSCRADIESPDAKAMRSPAAVRPARRPGRWRAPAGVITLAVFALAMLFFVGSAHAHPPNLCKLDPMACKRNKDPGFLGDLPVPLFLPATDANSPDKPDTPQRPRQTGGGGGTDTEDAFAGERRLEKPRPKKPAAGAKDKQRRPATGAKQPSKRPKKAEAEPPAEGANVPGPEGPSTDTSAPALTRPASNNQTEDAPSADSPPPSASPTEPTPPADESAEGEELPERSNFETAMLYLRLGYTHILPHGLDHILFVLALFLASTKLRSLLTQITAFTVAHTITLALAITGVVRAPPDIIEPLIALSIVFVAVENIYFKDMTKWRPFVVFAFGLFHGLGFASVLTDLGLPSEQFVSALISFNVGVEIGQLSVVALALVPSLYLIRVLKKEGVEKLYRQIAVVPASLAIAAVGLFWTIQRTFGWG